MIGVRQGNNLGWQELPLYGIMEVEIFNVWEIDFMGFFCAFKSESKGGSRLCFQVGIANNLPNR